MPYNTPHPAKGARHGKTRVIRFHLWEPSERGNPQKQQAGWWSSEAREGWGETATGSVCNRQGRRLEAQPCWWLYNVAQVWRATDHSLKTGSFVSCELHASKLFFKCVFVYVCTHVCASVCVLSFEMRISGQPWDVGPSLGVLGWPSLSLSQ